MTTPLTRRTRSAATRAPRLSLAAPELFWLYAVLGLVFVGGVAVMAGIKCGAGEVESTVRAERPTTPGPAVATAVHDPEPAATPAHAAVAQPSANDDAPPPVVAEAEPHPMPEPVSATTARAPERPRPVASEYDLRYQLLRAPEVGLKPATRDRLVESYKTSFQSNAAMGRKPSFDPSILVKRMPTAGQLPLRGFPVCQLPPERAATLGVLSRALHAYLDGFAPRDATGKRGEPSRVREVLRAERRGKPPTWLTPEALPAMTQILMAEDVPLRLILVDMMADIPGKAASVRLAQRAVFDLSPDVRQAAVEALQQRPAVEARKTLVDAMRYPWPAAADHAADALVALADRDATPLLVALLDKPDPALPFPTKNGASVHEIVRVNHVQNCLLCHVPSVGRDPVTDVDPFARRPDQTYDVGYGGPKLPGANGGVWSNRVLIRADVQFLRQDFSVAFPPVSDFATAGGLRFDFLVRTRPLKPDEVKGWTNKRPAAATYPQREAVLYALRGVTGLDAGSTTDAWLALFPDARAVAEAVRLAAALRTSPADQHGALLTRYRDARDDRGAEVLAHAIPHVTVRLQDKLRAALVERFGRLPADDLRALLDGDGELRQAAAWACVRAANAASIPDLIGLLTDADAALADAAHQTLQRLTGEDFGPPAGSPQRDREEAATRWQAWHREHGR